MLSRYDLVKNFPNGDRYVGEATESNVKDGKGTYTWSSGATYSGEWKKDVMHGKGIWKVPGLDGYEYEGPFISGSRQGVGKCRYNNGRRYEGNWLNNSCCGDGVLFGSPSDLFEVYTGPFRASLFHGENGEMKYHNGDVYRGEWEGGVRHGYGVLTSPSGASHDVIQYEGTFVQDVPTGRGAMTLRNGTRYEGDHHNFSPHGQGTQLISQANVRYDGGFCNGKRHGQGTLASPQWSYSGSWLEGLRHGRGKFMSGDGISGLRITQGDLSLLGGVVEYDGSWVEDEMEGTVQHSGANVVHYDSGAVYHGDMKKSQPSGVGRLQRGTMMFVVGHTSCTMQLEYDGVFLEGLPHGEGKGSWSRSTGSTVDDAAMALLDDNGNPTLVHYGLHPATFTGTWCRGYPCGMGELEWGAQVGAQYKGTVHNGLMHTGPPHTAPAGLISWRKGTQVRAEYRGGFVNGLRSGPDGRMRYKNDDVYDGEWLNDLRHGEGKFFQNESNNSYSGHWQDGLYHGNGKEIIYGKEFYHGEFQNGFRHGKGLLKFTNDSLRYEGEFAFGLFEGVGTLELPAQGKRHAGAFSKGLCHGLVETKFSNGNVYHGNYVRGESSGEGTMKYTNGDSYTGQFAPGEVRHGAGVFHFAGGARLECTWEKNVVHGHGKHTDHNGVVQMRHYIDGHHASQAAGPMEHEGSPEQRIPAVHRATVAATTTTPAHVDDYQLLDDVSEGASAPSRSASTPNEPEEPPKRRSSSPAPTVSAAASAGASASPPRVLPLSLAGLRAHSQRERSGGQPTPPTTAEDRSASQQELEDKIEAATQRIAHLNATIRSSVPADGKKTDLLKATRTREVQSLLKLVAFHTM